MELFLFEAIIVLLFILVMERNKSVYAYRLLLINAMYAAGIRDSVEDGLSKTNHRYSIYKQISYEQMLFKFWKSLDSFWTEAELKVMIE